MHNVSWRSIRTGSIFAVVLGIGSLCVAQLNQVQLGQPGVITVIQDYGGVRLPSDRRDGRGIQEAEERIAAGEYTQAIEYLDELLQRKQDSFIANDELGEYRGLKETARRILSDLPPAAQEFYQETFERVARRQLATAVEQGDYEQLKGVAQRFFHTTAGYQASMLLAQYEADMGRHLSAALTYEQLLQTPQAQRQLQPQLSLLAAASYYASGDLDRAEEILANLPQSAGADLEIGGKRVSLAQMRNDPSGQLSRLFQVAEAPQQKSEQEWITPRGNPSRNGQSEGGLPHARVKWQVRLLSHPNLEDVYEKIEAMLLRQEKNTAVAAVPLAVGDYVITRSAHNLFAVDFESGKRIWQAEPQRVAEFERLINAADEESGDTDLEPAHAFARRVWEDYLYSSISSDGQHVYAIRDLSPPSPVRRYRSRNDLNESFETEFTNRLCAYDLATQGKLIWEIDGQSDKDGLKSAFFLGAPLAVGHSLFCLAEITSENAIYLLSLNRRTGELLWKQQLADLETGIRLSPARRLQACMPSYDAGILVCPTGAGAIIGVDLAMQSLAWAYQYEPEDLSQSFRRARRSQLLRSTTNWIDSPVIIAKGRVVLSPPESGELHCVDLATGNLIWKQQRDDFHYVAGVHQDCVLLVSGEQLEGLSLEDGEPLWPEQSLPFPEESVPTGRGFFSNNDYYLPLSNGSVIVVDLREGTIVDQSHSREGDRLGNLICHRGAVLSQSGRFLDRYDQIDVLRRRSRSRLEENPSDFEALRTLGEMAFNEGDLSEAVDLLMRAYNEQPDNLLVRQVLGECLMDALDSDFAAYRDSIPVLRKVLDDSEESKLTLLRLQAQGLTELGEYREAFAHCRQIFEQSESIYTMLQPNGGHQVKLSRWLQGQVAAIYRSSSASDREEIEKQIQLLLEENSAGASLERFISAFGNLEFNELARLRLAREWIEKGELLAAQQLLLDLVDSGDPSIRAEAVARCSKMLHEADQPRLAMQFDQLLGGPLKETVCLEDQTGSQCLEAWGKPELRGAMDWPYGQVEITPLQTTGNESVARRGRPPLSGIRLERCDDVLGSCSIRFSGMFSGRNRRLVIRDSYGREFFRANLDTARNVRMHDPGNVYGVSRGSLLVVSLGRQIVAFNTLSAAEDESSRVLWRKSTTHQLDTQIRNTRRFSSGVSDRPGSYRAPRSKDGEEWIGVVGPVSSETSVYQEDERLVCVDNLTGELEWAVDHLPRGCDLYGDGEYIVAVPPESSRAWILSAVDGRQIDQVDAIPWEEQVATLGRNVVRWQKQQNGRYKLATVDILTGETLWDRQFERTSKIDVDRGRYVAVVEYSGKATILDASTGETLVEESIEPLSSVSQIHLLAGSDHFLLAVQSPSHINQERLITGFNLMDYTTFDGKIFAFNRQTGRSAWTRPAEVRQEALALSQPADLPVVAFTSNVRRNNNRRNTQISLMFLEKSSGRLIFHDETLPSSVNHCVLKVAEEDPNSVVVEMVSGELRLDFTGKRRPPEPPMISGIDQSGEGKPGGLRRIGQKLLGGN